MQDNSVGKGSCHQNWQNGSNPWAKYSGKREQTPTSCLLIFGYMCTQAHTQTHTGIHAHIHAYTRKSKFKISKLS